MLRLLSPLALLLVASGTLIAPCASSTADGAEPSAENAFRSATWRVTFKWDNGTGTAYFTFYDNGTFKTSDGYRGRFFQIDRRAVVAFDGAGGVPAWSCVYSLTVAADGQSFTGIQGWSHTSGKPKGTHVGVRARFAEEPEDMNRFLESSDRAIGAIGAKRGKK